MATRRRGTLRWLASAAAATALIAGCSKDKGSAALPPETTAPPASSTTAAAVTTPPSTFTPSPDRRGIVDLPEVLSVDQAQTLIFQVPILNQAVVLRAFGQRYDWTFGDGTSLSTDAPGPPFEAGTTCDSDTACSGYVHHTYRAAGRYPIQVTIAWHGKLSVQGGAWQDIPANCG